jgi:hypothetical protein
MTIRNRQDHLSSGAPRGSRSKSLRPYLVFLGLLLLLLSPLATVPSQAQLPSGVAVPPDYFGLTFNNDNTASAMSGLPEPEQLTYGMDRLWDGDAQWPEIEISNGNFDWTELETWLANDAQNGVTTAWYTMNRTPLWALGPISGTCSSLPGQPACDTRCNDYDAANPMGAGAPGQCYPPADLNPDGSGTDDYWKNWVTALAKENVQLCASTSPKYACIRYYEIWNEIDRNSQGYPFPQWAGTNYTAPYLSIGSPLDISNGNNSYFGSFAELVRMLQDAECIILGRSSLGTVDQVPYAIENVNGPTNPPVSCTAVNGIQGPGTAYSATFVSPSSHTYDTQELEAAQDFLYCNVSGVTPGAPNYCNTGSEAAQEVGAINFHMKPANVNESGDTIPEVEMLNEYCAIVGGTNDQTPCSGIKGILNSSTSTPVWNGEGGYSGEGWDPSSGAENLEGNPDMQASFIARYALVQWSLGIQGFNWYDYDISNTIDGLTEPYVMGTGGSCTTVPLAEVPLSDDGMLSGAVTVISAGFNCGTGSGITWQFVGNGTPGTASFSPTFSNGTLASGTVSPGTSSGYSLESVNGINDQALDPSRAYDAVSRWMTNMIMTTACGNGGSGTEWQCDFSPGPNSNLPSGYESSAIWNTSSSYGCMPNSDRGSACNNVSVTVPSTWTLYRDLWGDEYPIQSNQVPVGNLPILLENESSNNNP